MDGVFVYLAPLPPNIKESVIPCSDGYTIYINENLSGDERIDAYFHALFHIEHGDYNKDDIQAIESAAHFDSK